MIRYFLIALILPVGVLNAQDNSSSARAGTQLMLRRGSDRLSIHTGR